MLADSRPREIVLRTENSVALAHEYFGRAVDQSWFLHLQVGKVFKIDDIVEAHRCMEENRGGGKIVVLT